MSDFVILPILDQILLHYSYPGSNLILYPCLRSLCSSEYRDLLPSFEKEDSLVDAGQLSDSSKEFAHCLIQVSQLFK